MSTVTSCPEIILGYSGLRVNSTGRMTGRESAGIMRNQWEYILPLSVASCSVFI
jgi:hypothetical protein